MLANGCGRPGCRVANLVFKDKHRSQARADGVSICLIESHHNWCNHRILLPNVVHLTLYSPPAQLDSLGKEVTHMAAAKKAVSKKTTKTAAAKKPAAKKKGK